MSYTSININNGMSSSQLESAILEIQYNINLAISKNDKNKEEGYKSLLLKAQQYMIQAKERESQASSGGGGNTGGNNAPEKSTTRTVFSSTDVPDASSGASYEEVKAAMRQNLRAEISRLNSKIFSSPQQQRRAKELANRLMNFDSYFDNVWRTEIAPQIKSKTNTPLYPGIPSGAIPSSDGMAPATIQEQALLAQTQNSRFRPQLEGMAQRPITWEERNRMLGIKPKEQTGQMTTKKPPVSSIPQQPTPTTSMNPVDENGIPIVRTSAGWVKDRRFYKPDGTLFGMM